MSLPSVFCVASSRLYCFPLSQAGWGLICHPILSLLQRVSSYLPLIPTSYSHFPPRWQFCLICICKDVYAFRVLFVLGVTDINYPYLKSVQCDVHTCKTSTMKVTGSSHRVSPSPRPFPVSCAEVTTEQLSITGFVHF